MDEKDLLWDGMQWGQPVMSELLQFAWLKLALWELTAQESGPRGGSLSPSHQTLAIEPPHPWVLLHSGAPVTLAWAGASYRSCSLQRGFLNHSSSGPSLNAEIAPGDPTGEGCR